MIVEKILKASDLAYLAGLIDGEGSITLTRRLLKGNHPMPNYLLSVSVNMTNREPVEFMSRYYRGSLSNNRKTVTGKAIYMFRTSTLESQRMLSDISPFLKCKHRQARWALAFRKLPQAWGHPTHDEMGAMIRQRDNYVSLMHRLNAYSCSIQT